MAELYEIEAAGAASSQYRLTVKDLKIVSGTNTIIILPTADPHVSGALWNNSGTVTVSSG